MSGDVQPRKRKDKKRKKDDLGVSEPRGTAAALGDGDVFMHSQHEHGTGGHWCAKIVFFSLLAILVGLVGLIILENRGLSELEANAVQSQYSGVLEGWLEDAPEDDHHDEHTLDLNHHDDDDDADHTDEIEHSEEADDEHDENDHDESHNDEDDEDEEPEEDENDEDSQEQDLEANDEDEDLPYRKYYQSNQAEPNTDDEDDDDDDNDQNYQEIDDDDDENEQENEDDQNYLEPKLDDDDTNEDSEFDQYGEDNDEDIINNPSAEDNGNSQEDDEVDENDVNQYDNQESEEVSQEGNNEDDDEHDDDQEEDDASLEVERIEHEASDEEPISTELPALPEPDDDDDDGDDKAQAEGDDAGSDDDANDAVDTDDADDVDDADDGFLEADDEEPPVERITAPAGKPFDEVEEESSEKPADTLEDEEEYEKRQEELRREEAQASHMWLKLTVGGALLVATHAIVRRATASSDEPQTGESAREETPAVDRRMTLIPEEPSESVAIRKVTQESTRPVVQDVAKQIPSIVKSAPTFEDSEDEGEEEQEEPVASKAQSKQQEKPELYSDEEEPEDEEIEEEEEEEVKKKAAPQVARQPTPEPEEDVPDDVEIIDDEIEEEAEEDDEEEISDVDDEELLTRLEAKYGRLPEPERPQRHKDGGNSVDEWPGEPADAYWRQQLDSAEREFNQGAWLAAADRASAKQLLSSARARFLVAKSLDAAAEEKRDNTLLGRAITAYLELLKMNERLSDKKLLEVTRRTIDRIQFRGNYLNAEPVYRLLIRRFPDDPSLRNNLTVTFLMANRADLAEEVLKETLKRWPDERLALAQYGFVLKTQHNRLEEAADYLQRALEGDTGPATEPRYYYHLGDTYLLLGRFKEAEDIHKRGAAHGHFLSPAQRSLYNVPRLRAKPWWDVAETPYVKLARSLESSWREILREGEAAFALYEEEKEGLRERGQWGQLDLFVRGREVAGRCARAPAACRAVRAEPAAAGCRRGQAKFSVMQPGTHVRPHVGPTNCRLRMHLGLANTTDTFLRVDREIRQWKPGEVLIFDDSFEHEVWHNGTGARLVLIVDVWHPDLTPAERRSLPAI